MRRYSGFFKNQGGFTLIDLIVVTAIICLLVVILVPGYLHFIEDARKQATLSEARSIYMAAQIRATEFKSSASKDKPYRIPNAEDLRSLVGPDDIYKGVTKLTIVDDAMDGSIDKIEMIKDGINVIIEPGKAVIIDGKERTRYNSSEQ